MTVAYALRESVEMLKREHKITPARIDIICAQILNNFLFKTSLTRQNLPKISVFYNYIKNQTSNDLILKTSIGKTYIFSCMYNHFPRWLKVTVYIKHISKINGQLK